MLNNNYVKIKELVLTEVNEKLLCSAKRNLILFKNYFSIDKITFICSDMLKQVDQTYYNYFDIVLANMPQTPSKTAIRSKHFYNNIIVDKYGGNDGAGLYSELINNISKYVVKDFKMFNL